MVFFNTQMFASFRGVLTSIILHFQNLPFTMYVTFTIHLYSKFHTTTFSGSLSHQTEGKLMCLYDHHVITVRSQTHLRQVAQIPVFVTVRNFYC